MCPTALNRSITLSLILALSVFALPAWSMAATQASFVSPKSAVVALILALARGKSADLVRILGPESADLVSSGDSVADQEARGRFLANYHQGHRIILESPRVAILILGADQFPFAIPLHKIGARWRFDSTVGREEILNRRIGRNEINAIDVCRTYVEAQNDFIARGAAGVSLPEYAQHILSTAGSHDGLYWPTDAQEPESPLGPLISFARAEGYDGTKDPADHPLKPYHGYLYRILTAQGPHAGTGAHDYIVAGHMIGGFALVAFPQHYGQSGIMSFIINHDGVVYQKDLGADTLALASQMSVYDPGAGWMEP
jgi:hypothetical protein